MIDLSTVLVVAGPLLGVAVAWGAMGARLRQVGLLSQAIETLQKQLVAVDARFRESAESQGKRLGGVEDKVSLLRGQFDGFERGRRSRTAAQGHPTVGDKGE